MTERPVMTSMISSIVSCIRLLAARKRRRAVILGLAAGSLLAAGVAVASVSAPAAIHGCINKTRRVLTVPKAGQTCPRGTNAVSWDITGPAGPPGPAPGFLKVISGPKFGFGSPHGLAFDGTNIWVANSGNNSVTEVKASDGGFVRNLSGSSFFFDVPVAIAIANNDVWVVNRGISGIGSVTVLNASNGAFIANLSGASYNFITPC